MNEEILQAVRKAMKKKGLDPEKLTEFLMDTLKVVHRTAQFKAEGKNWTLQDMFKISQALGVPIELEAKESFNNENVNESFIQYKSTNTRERKFHIELTIAAEKEGRLPEFIRRLNELLDELEIEG